MEYAILRTAIPPFIFGIMDSSRSLYSYDFVSNAAREATRHASVHGSTFASQTGRRYSCHAHGSDVQGYVQGLAPALTTSRSLTVTTACTGQVSRASVSCTSTANSTPRIDHNPVCLMQVVESYPFHFMLPFLPKGATTRRGASTSATTIAE